MGLLDCLGGDVIQGPGLGIENVLQCVALDDIGPSHHADKQGVRAEVGDARKGSEVSNACQRARADEADRLGSR